MSDFFSNVKAACNFEEVSRFHGIEFGHNLKALCPFHGPEKTPSLSLHSSRTYAHCFGCGWEESGLFRFEKLKIEKEKT